MVATLRDEDEENSIYGLWIPPISGKIALLLPWRYLFSENKILIWRDGGEETFEPSSLMTKSTSAHSDQKVRLKIQLQSYNEYEGCSKNMRTDAAIST